MKVSELLAASPPLPELIGEDQLPGLAYALAAGVRPPDAVLLSYGLDPTDNAVAVLLDSPQFVRLFEQALAEQRTEEDGQDRVRNRARRAVEKTIGAMETAISSAAPLSERVSAFRAVAKVAGLEDPPPVAGLGEKFVINIALPGQDARASVTVLHTEVDSHALLHSPGGENGAPVIEGRAEPMVEEELGGDAALKYLDRDIFGQPLPG